MPSSYDITIEKLVTGGAGLGRTPDGLVVLVPAVLPGERVRIAPSRRRRGHLEAELLEVLEPSPDRVEPPCRCYWLCGGCDFQHLAYPAQLRAKEAILREQLARSGLTVPAEAWAAPLASPRQLQYRVRLRMQVDHRGRLGFFRNRSRTVEPVARCLLARPEIVDLPVGLSNHPAWEALGPECTAVELLASPADGRQQLVFHLHRKPRSALFRAAGLLLQAFPGLLAIMGSGPDFAMMDLVSGKTAAGEGPVCRFTLPHTATGARPLTLMVEPGGFSQVNEEQNLRMIAQLLEWAPLKSSDRLLDLFCGMGNFSLPLALHAKEVVGCDLQGAAIRSARRNSALAGLSNTRFLKQSSQDGLELLLKEGSPFEVVLLDPPRQGCAQVVPFLDRLGAGRLVYISCDPATLARDLTLLSGCGFYLERLRLIDMFPQTHHLETMALLGRQPT